MTSLLSGIRTPVRRSSLFMAAVGSIALVAAITNSAASVGFPVGARWERVVNALVTVDLLIMAVVLIVAAVITSRGDATRAETGRIVIDQRGDELPTVPSGAGVLVVIGLVLLVVDWILWLAFGLPTLIHGLVAQDASYLFTTTVVAIFGPLWALGTVLAVIGFHRGGSPRNRRLSLIGAVLTVAMMAIVVLAALLFAMGVIL